MANHACMNLQIAEAQPLFCKERLILLSVSFVYVLIRLENKRPVLLHDGERRLDAQILIRRIDRE